MSDDVQTGRFEVATSTMTCLILSDFYWSRFSQWWTRRERRDVNYEEMKLGKGELHVFSLMGVGVHITYGKASTPLDSLPYNSYLGASSEGVSEFTDTLGSLFPVYLFCRPC